MLPSATEMIFAIGAGDQLLACSHECDWPPEASSLPKVVKNRMLVETMSSLAIDRGVSSFLGSGQSLYEIDLAVLKSARPDILLTQDLCDVCAVTGSDLEKAFKKVRIKPRVVTQTPSDLGGVLADIRSLGKILLREPEADALVRDLRRRIQLLKKAAAARTKVPKVFCLEWFDPPYACGHWVPELVELAGGREVLGIKGKKSIRTDWKSVAAADPDVIVLMPCGYTLERAAGALKELDAQEGWTSLRAVLNKRVITVDANAYFSRPGPRLIDGAERLAELLKAL